MKKKILGIALVAMSFVAFNGIAQTTSGNTSIKQENVKCKKADRKGHRPQRNLFEGLTLTDVQKSQLQQLDAKRKTARKQQAQACADSRQCNDSARMAQRQASKRAYLDEVKAIIGPEQYVVFLENMYINGGAHHHGKAAISQCKNGNDNACHKKHDRTNRP